MRPVSVPEPRNHLRSRPQLMDLIVSTPQGEAEISVNAVHESVTVGDLLGPGAQLGATQPGVRRRPADADGHVDHAQRASSPDRVIEVSAPLERLGDGEVTLVQAAGEGGGNRRPLGPGRYSLGTARRANVAPLTFNQVLVPRCEIVVEHSGPCHGRRQPGRPRRPRRRHIPAPWERPAAANRPSGVPARRRDPRPRGIAAADPARPAQLRPGPTRRSRPPNPSPTVGRATAESGVAADAPAAPNVPPPPPVVVRRPRCKAAYDAELDSIRRTHLDLAEVVRRATQAVRAPVGAPACRRRRVHLQRRSRRSTLDTGRRRSGRSPRSRRCCRPHRFSSTWSISAASVSPAPRRRLGPRRGHW